ncbi:MarR family transcriptional regulator [Amycolatopsis minnesotensis]|uniref:MarR family transcriptional regulator n=1 Tax=Amycolatopsis minnesotensis TaxID=337894 RepID=A0ABN2S3Z3_9PSEU
MGKVLDGARLWSTETVMFHTAIAETAGLSATESKTADYLDRLGPLTPKELAKHSGLAPASVTALIDRMERKGVVRRRPHPGDRRKVLVEIDSDGLRADVHLWDFLISSVVKACASYSEAELDTIVRFIGEATEITHEATARLPGHTKEIT